MAKYEKMENFIKSRDVVSKPPTIKEIDIYNYKD